MKYNFDEIIDRENTNCLKYDFRRTYFGTNDVIPMWVADMDFKVAPEILAALQQRIDHGIFGYTLKPTSYYNSIVRWMEKRHNWTIRPSWISHTSGIVPALGYCINAFTRPGDKVLTFTPIYHPFLWIIPNNGRQLVTQQLKEENNRYVIDFDALEKTIDKRTKMLLLSNPHNPGGRVWTADELKTLGDMCVKHNIIIVSDEIHSDLIMPGYQHVPLASLSAEIADKTITCMAPSKTFNLAGLTTSEVIISNRQMKEDFDMYLANMELQMGNMFGYIALEAAYTQGEAWLEQLIAYLHANYVFLKNYIDSNIPQIKVMNLEATYLVWLDCKALNMDAKALKRFFISEAKVGMNSGDSFGQGGEGYHRINIACPRATLERALQQISEAINKL